MTELALCQTTNTIIKSLSPFLSLSLLLLYRQANNLHEWSKYKCFKRWNGKTEDEPAISYGNHSLTRGQSRHTDTHGHTNASTVVIGYHVEVWLGRPAAPGTRRSSPSRWLNERRGTRKSGEGETRRRGLGAGRLRLFVCVCYECVLRVEKRRRRRKGKGKKERKKG